MGLAVRVIPTLLARGDKLVKGMRFDSWRTVGVVEQAARICGLRGVDEIILLDIEATPAGRGPNVEMVQRIAANFFTPLTVGGGIRTLEDAQQLLRAGADKVAIGTGAYEPGLLEAIAGSAGCQAVVVAIDVKNRLPTIRCGRVPVVENVVQYAKDLERRGAGEILLTSVEREGTMEGYDINLVRVVSKAVGIPVIAHGGCRGADDMLNALHAGADAVAAGSLFQFTNTTPLECAEWLAAHGVETRVPA